MQNHMNAQEHLTHEETELLEIIHGSEDPAAVARYIFGLISDYLKTHPNDVKPVIKSNDNESRLLEIIKGAPNPYAAITTACCVFYYFANDDNFAKADNDTRTVVSTSM